jgi:photosystem II stability/assembly factor-like uncharacterized protein
MLRAGAAPGGANLRGEKAVTLRIRFILLVLIALVPGGPPSAAPREKKAAAGSAGVRRDLSPDDLKAVSWRSVGPANMGGRVSALAFVPGSAKSFYVGFGTGGVFKTDNMGVTFRPVFDKYPVLSIGALAVADAPPDWAGWASEKAPEAPPAAAAPDKDKGKGKIVWVGTGEGNNRNSSSWGNGVYRSVDAGATFTHLGLEETHDIPRLAVDPRNPDVCYVAALGHLWGANAQRGIFKTADGGKSWQHVLKIDERTGASDVLIDPQKPETVYAAMYARRRTPWSFTGNSETGGIFRSDDAGRTWKKLTRGLPARTGRIGLTLFPANPRLLYAVVESDAGGTGRDPFEDRSAAGGLFRSEDRGDSWVRVSDYNFRPFYFSRVAVDPVDDRRVYLPGWDLAVSDDGGRTFRRSGSEKVHVDFHAIVVNPDDPSEILVGNDGGVYLSHDRAATWDFLNNVAVGQFYRIAVDGGDPYRIAGGLQDNGSWMGPSETFFQTDDEDKDGIDNSDWRAVGGSDGFTVAFDPTDRNLIYVTGQGGELIRNRLDNNALKLIRPAPREGQERFRFNWNSPYLISRHDPAVLYMGGNRVFKLTERGDRWSAISPDLSRRETDKIQTVGSDAETYGTIVALAESPLQPGVLWAGTDDGLIHVTTDDGKHWADVTPKEVGGLYVSRIAASAHEAQTAYVAVDGHRSDVFRPILLMTRDLGRTWTGIAANLPPREPVRVIAEDPGNPELLYAGTEFGIYAALDRGRSWLKLNGKSLPPAPVDDIVVHPRERDLIVGTHGRSIWILDDASFLAQLGPEVRGRPLTLLDVLPARPRLYFFRGYGGGHGGFRAKNPPMGAILNYWVREDTGENAEITVADAAGFVIRKLDGPARAGLNRVVWDLQADKKHLFSGVDQNLGQTQFVPAGEYRVTVTVGEEKSVKTVKVLAAPSAGS